MTKRIGLSGSFLPPELTQQMNAPVHVRATSVWRMLIVLGWLFGAGPISCADQPGPLVEKYEPNAIRSLQTDQPVTLVLVDAADTSVASTSAAGQRAETDALPTRLDAALIAAWEEAGATFGWIGERALGTWRADAKPRTDDIPAFRFSSAEGMSDSLPELPQPGVPFAVLCNVADDAALRALARLTHLHTLIFPGARVTEAGLRELSQLQQLRTLVFLYTPLTDTGVRELIRLTQLQTLSLAHTRVTDAGLKELVGLAQLQTLDLRFTKVADPGLKELVELTRLRSLSLRGTQVTDAGLKELARLPQLQTLDLDSTLVTDTGFKELQEALSKCSITR